MIRGLQRRCLFRLQLSCLLDVFSLAQYHSQVNQVAVGGISGSPAAVLSHLALLLEDRARGSRDSCLVILHLWAGSASMLGHPLDEITTQILTAPRSVNRVFLLIPSFFHATLL